MKMLKKTNEALALSKWALNKAVKRITEDIPIVSDPLFESKIGVFVTLKKNVELKGCVGRIIPFKELKYEIIECTTNAATHDERFSPIQFEEFDEISIEISLLFDIQKTNIDEIEIGKHGIYLEALGRSAVFLPEVPFEQEWDLNKTLTNLCFKAGLHKNIWKDDGCDIYKFITQKIK